MYVELLIPVYNKHLNCNVIVFVMFVSEPTICQVEPQYVISTLLFKCKHIEIIQTLEDRNLKPHL